MKTIKYLKKSQYFCDGCQKEIKGEGYIIPAKKRVYCPFHYFKEYPQFEKEEK